MILKPMDILSEFPVRKSGKQKQAFRDAVSVYAENLGYTVAVEKGSLGVRNLIIGDPERAEYLITAHYDTPAAMLLPNLITPTNPVTFILYQLFLTVLLIVPPFFISLLLGLCVLFAGALYMPAEYGMEIAVWVLLIWYAGFLILFFLGIAMLYFGPANKNNANDNTSGIVTLLEIARTLQEDQRSKVCFVLFDMEEKGLLGSLCYRRTHRMATDQQLVINLDCVGDGDNLLIFPTKKLKKGRKMLSSFYRICGYWGKKSLVVHEKGFGYNPSDYRHFPYGVGIVALKKSKFGLYLGRIHTRKDTVLEQTNVNILRAAIVSYICCSAANRKEVRK